MLETNWGNFFVGLFWARRPIYQMVSQLQTFAQEICTLLFGEVLMFSWAEKTSQLSAWYTWYVNIYSGPWKVGDAAYKRVRRSYVLRVKNVSRGIISGMFMRACLFCTRMKQRIDILQLFG